MLMRIIFIVIMLALWFLVQRLLGARGFPEGGIQDKVHVWTDGWNKFLGSRPDLSRWLLISSSLVIDLTGVYIFAGAIFGPSIAPFLGLVALMALRQVSQYLTALPPPPGMIWTHPGVPSLLVTYGVANDFFFSGHTALAVFGGMQLFHSGILSLQILGIAIAIFEASTVLILRAHWTMDVYAGVVTALLVDLLASRWAPVIDHLLS